MKRSPLPADLPIETVSTTPEGWRAQLRGAIRDPDQLIDRLSLSDELRPGARRSHELFPCLVPESFLRRMVPGDPSDPLLRQVLPLLDEAEEAPEGFVADAVGDQAATRTPGLIHKYRGRALLIVAGVCAVSCRYCFRRHFPYDETPATAEEWAPVLATIAADDSIEEVILSGGDPLMRSDRWLRDLIEQIEAIPHVTRLRLHTRLPIVLPARVDDDFLALLDATRLAPTVVVHANHPSEIDAECGGILEGIVRAGIPVLNQSVLLRGVNDSAEALIELSRRLLSVRVLPYYLHQLDRVVGAAHFEVPEARGLELIEAMRAALPGFGVPRYVREVPGAPNKVEIIPRDESPPRRQT